MDRCQAKAIRVAIRELKDAAAAQAFDANAYTRLGARYPQAVRAAKRTREIRAAIDELRSMLGEPVQPEGEM